MSGSKAGACPKDFENGGATVGASVERSTFAWTIRRRVEVPEKRKHGWMKEKVRLLRVSKTQALLLSTSAVLSPAKPLEMVTFRVGVALGEDECCWVNCCFIKIAWL